MATPPLKLTRDQLATFLKDQRQIRAFENLFTIAEEVDIVGILEVALNAGNADQKAQQALDGLQRILDAIGLEYVAADTKAQQALDSLQRIADTLDTLVNKPEIQHHNGTVTDYIDLPIAGPHVTQPRRVQWNEDDGTVDVGLYGDSVLQVGQEIMYYAKNTSGGLITNGTPVMFTGTVGSSGKLTFGKAVANGTFPSEYMMGVATQDIDNNAFGYVTSFGLVRGWNTTGSPYGESWNDGDLLYFDPATPGTWTKVKPAAPNIRIPVAVVINAGSGGSGSIFVRMQTEESLEDLQDVQYVAVPANGELIRYNSSNTRWENTDRLAQVWTASSADGQVLIFSNTSGQYVPALITPGTNISVSNGAGSVTIATTSSITATLTDNSTDLIKSSSTLTNGAGAAIGTLTNAPAAGDPTKWVAIDDNGTTRYIPAW